jgi:hypothetical protein
MPEYRIYTIGIDGHFIGREALVCDSDDAAAEEARRELNVPTVEVWCGTRMVIRLAPRPASAPR